MNIFSFKSTLGALVLGLSLTGCATVQPWERSILAKPQMTLSPNPYSSEMRGHIYSSREAGAGGSLANGGGGCGCY